MIPRLPDRRAPQRASNQHLGNGNETGANLQFHYIVCRDLHSFGVGYAEAQRHLKRGPRHLLFLLANTEDFALLGMTPFVSQFSKGHRDFVICGVDEAFFWLVSRTPASMDRAILAV